MDKFRNCETLLVLLSNKMSREFGAKVDYFMYAEDVERNGVFKWEHRIPDGSEDYNYLTTGEEDSSEDEEEDNVQTNDGPH